MSNLRNIYKEQVTSENMKKETRGQVTLFVIIGLIIIVGVVSFLVLRGMITLPGKTTTMPNPNEDIRKCVETNIQGASDYFIGNAGFANPVNYKLYQDEKVPYLCYNVNYYLPCVNQKPLYISYLKNEIKNYLAPKIDKCFSDLEKNYKAKGYNVVIREGNLTVDFSLREIKVNIDKKMSLTKGELSASLDGNSISLQSPLYDMALVSNEIVSQESKFCYFENLGFMLTYSWISITKRDIGGETKIYSLKDKETGKTMRIAIRSCALPGGI